MPDQTFFTNSEHFFLKDKNVKKGNPVNANQPDVNGERPYFWKYIC